MHVLTFITFCMKFIKHVIGEYSEWSDWTACSVRCGNGTSSRYRGCKSNICHNQMIQVETKACYQACPKPSHDFGKCTEESEYMVLYNGGHDVEAGFPLLYSSENFCPSAGQYFTLIATDVPFILKLIYFKMNLLEKVFIDYTIEYGSTEWFPYMTEESSEVPLETSQEENNVFKVDFVEKFQVYAARFTVQSHSSCLQLAVHGCHTSYKANMVFEKSYVEELLDFTDNQVYRFQYTCYVDFIPMYFNYLKIKPTFQNKVLTTDKLQLLSYGIASSNTKYANGRSAISLFLLIASFDSLENDFYCYAEGGMKYCHSHFLCTGKTETIDDKAYMFGEHGTLQLVYKIDMNECTNTTICPVQSNCVNIIGSYYCECNSGYYGDGKNCFAEEYWVSNKLGAFNTGLFPDFPIDEDYCRMLFYATKTASLFTCSQYGAPSRYGCFVSSDLGNSWDHTYLRVDSIYGEDLSSGMIYGGSSHGGFYFLYNPTLDRWYGITPDHFKRASSSPHFNSNRTVNPNCWYNSTRDDTANPFRQAIYPIRSDLSLAMLAITQKGVVKLVDGIWKSILNWNDLPDPYSYPGDTF